ncbi:MAG: ribonuclease P protein component [Chitinophagales bacterium]|nr:ribonuclease P protein component [Chitinophagales bacterium]
MPAIFTYNKKEKLKSKKLLDELFTQGNSFVVFPIKIFFKVVENKLPDTTIQVGVGVSKKYFKHATKRNRIKRLLRETYRQNKLSLHELLNNNNKQLTVFFLYIDKELISYQTLENKMKIAIEKLIKQLS